MIVDHDVHVHTVLLECNNDPGATAANLVARAGLSVEINVCMFPGALGQTRPGFHDETFLRVLALAAEAGCRFHFGSDAHAVSQMDAVRGLGSYASKVGIGPADILPLFRPGGARQAPGQAAPAQRG